jgi:Fe-S cluster biogenesis protein NfuA
MSADVKITAEPLSVPAMCRFTVDRPVYPDRAYFFGSREAAEGSPLAERLFAIPGVVGLLISHQRLTVTKRTPEPWQVIGKQIGSAIREHLTTGLPAVNPELHERLPPTEVIRERVQAVIERDIMPGVRSHGGVIRLLDVQGNTVFLQMGGGCQGCSSADTTLKQGVEVAIRSAVPEVGEILDTTDHAAGRNPYYTAGGHQH